MPTYQYACTECDHAFEQVQSFNEDSLTVCPRCEGRLRKVFNAVGVVFKGSGFYRTDSRTDARGGRGSGKSADSSGKSADSSSSSSTGSSSGSGSSDSSSASNGSSKSSSGTKAGSAA